MRWKNLDSGFQSRLEIFAALSPHEVLGLEVGANNADIRRSYLGLIKAYHPDRADAFMAKHNEEMLKIINSAYDKLREPK